MKYTTVIAAAIIILSCNSKKESETEKKDSEKTTASTVVLPLKMDYEGTTVIGKSENIVVVMNFNTDFVAGKLDNLGSYLADSVKGVLADGSVMNGTRDSVVASIKAWRESMTSAQQSYVGAVAVDNKDKGHEWVFQWIDETHNYKDGKKEHLIYHEDYRLENGKIREIHQYAQAVPEKK